MSSSGSFEPSIITEVKPASIALAAFLERRRVINVADDGNRGAVGERPEHLSQDRRRRVSPTARPSLQDDRNTGLLRGLDISARVLPAEDDKARDGAPLGDRAAQDLRRASRPSFEFRDHVLDAGDRLDLVGVARLEILDQWTLAEAAEDGEVIHLVARRDDAGVEAFVDE